MVEVECPLCSKTVDLGSDSTGTYECPYCEGDFEVEGDVKEDLMKLINEIKEGSRECFYVLGNGKKSSLIMPIKRALFSKKKDKQRRIIFLPDTNILLDYMITDSVISYFHELDLSEEFTITSRYHPGSEGGSNSSSNEITIRDKSGNEIRFQDREQRSNIVSFAKFMGCDIEGIGPYRYHKRSIEFKSNPEGRIGLY